MASKMNALDKVISYFNPEAGAKRAWTRYAASEMQKRYFEGGAKTERTQGWKRPGTSANGAMWGQLSTLRNTCRNLTRNNPWAEKALRVLTSNVIKDGIKARFRHKDKSVQDKISALWWAWAHTKQCDADGMNTFAGLQSQAFRCIVESGEVLIRRRRRRLSDNRVMPFQLQVLEPDFLDDTKDGNLSNGNEVIQGIEFNSIGERVAYYIYENHPGDKNRFRTSTKSNRILAKDIIHAYDPRRAGQVRGYPWAAPVVVRLNEFDQYEDAQLVKQRVTAAWCAFVQDINPPANATGLDKISSEGGTAKGKPVEYFQPGVIEYLPPGKQINFANPPAINGYNEYSLNVLRAIAAGFGMTYESLTGDLSNVNFASSRVGWLEFQRNVSTWQQNIVINHICDGVFAWFDEYLGIFGYDTSELEIKWVAPRREMMDPVKEGRATKDAIRSGLTSYSRALTELGLDPDEVLEEIKADMEKIKTMGIVIESDARVSQTNAGRPAGTVANTSD